MSLASCIQIWDRPDGLAVLALASDYKLECYAKACIFRPVVVEIINPDSLEFRVACWDHLSWTPGRVVRISGFEELTRAIKEVWHNHEIVSDGHAR